MTNLMTIEKVFIPYEWDTTDFGVLSVSSCLNKYFDNILMLDNNREKLNKKIEKTNALFSNVGLKKICIKDCSIFVKYIHSAGRSGILCNLIICY